MSSRTCRTSSTAWLLSGRAIRCSSGGSRTHSRRNTGASTYSAPFSDAGFWVSSKWKAVLHTAHFLTYLVSKGIVPRGVDRDTIEWAYESVDKAGTTCAAPGGPRYRATALGTVQNALVRHLLGSLGFDAFTEAGWIHVKESEFAGQCAYCGTATTTTMDHAIPINRLHLGEHRLGNLVPACAPCNSQKSNKTPAEYLRFKYAGSDATRQARTAELEAHQRRHGYRPIEDFDGVRPLVEEARARVKELADEFRDRINQQLNQSESGAAGGHTGDSLETMTPEQSPGC